MTLIYNAPLFFAKNMNTFKMHVETFRNNLTLDQDVYRFSSGKGVKTYQLYICSDT